MTVASLVLSFIALSLPASLQEEKPKGGPKVSFDKQVRPILQTHCQGCHQPAKTKGGYVMTSFDTLVKGGDDEGAAIVPGKPEQSSLLRMITPENGKAEMPKGRKPITPPSHPIELGPSTPLPVRPHNCF